ncbi:MAG TPA: hypothetical protein ENN75_03425 [candidate division Zixibacteria bacterium]|nr:hypothetical protein [candidate division Zixibacteria bacterium]
MKKAMFFIGLVILMTILVLGCSKEESKFKVVTLYAGPDTTKPAFSDPPHIVHVLVTGEAEKEAVGLQGIEILKTHLEKNPDTKRANLAVHSDSTNYFKRRPEVRIAYYGTGEPHVEVNRWK